MKVKNFLKNPKTKLLLLELSVAAITIILKFVTSYRDDMKGKLEQPIAQEAICA